MQHLASLGMPSLYGFIEAAILFVNALAILNEKKFLSKYGLDGGQPDVDQFGQSSGGIRQQIGRLLTAVRLLLRIPLIPINIIVIILELLFG